MFFKKKMLQVHIDSRFLNYLEASEVLTALGLHPLMATSGGSRVAAAPLDERVHSNLLLSPPLPTTLGQGVPVSL